MDAIEHNKPGVIRTVNRHFIRHYAQMVFVMFFGMAVLGLAGRMGPRRDRLQLGRAPRRRARGDAAPDGGHDDVPMAVWMRRMGHSWRVTNEMNASMILPTLAAIALGAAGLVDGIDTLLLGEHVAMLIAMFGVMVVRPEEYSGHGHHADAVAAT